MHKKLIIITIIIVFIIILAKITNIYTIFLKHNYPIKYNEYVEEYSKNYNVDKLLIYSIIKAESNFNTNAISSSGAKGLMQLMDSTSTEISNKIMNNNIDNINLLDPKTNIMIGTKYYSELLEKYNNNMLLALAAYNAGIGNLDEWISSGIIKSDGSNIENIPFKETNMYVRKIINNYKIYQKLYENV